MTFRQEPFNDDSERDGHADGWSEAFDKLELALGAASRATSTGGYNELVVESIAKTRAKP